MFSLGLCEKKKRQFFLFCFLLSKKKKDKTPFSRTFQQFSRLKNAQFPRTSYHSFVFFPPLSFYSSESKSNKKKVRPRLSASHLCPSRLVQHAATEIPHAQRRLQRTAEIVMLQSRQLHRSQNTRHVLLTERVAQLAGT